MMYRMTGLYAVVSVAGFAFFVWLLINMTTGSTQAPGFLSSLGVAFVLVMVAMGLAALMSRRDESDVDES
jgi:threonine/homoserine/homoserine lactone efflux protein